MSHFTRVRTRMVVKEYLIRAIEDGGWPYEDGDAAITDYYGNWTPVDLKIVSGSLGSDIGFKKVGETYEVVADWECVQDMDRESLVKELTRRYAYHAARSKLEEQGFSLVSEETKEEGRIHLLLRRTA